jgi:hypothetical protein
MTYDLYITFLMFSLKIPTIISDVTTFPYFFSTFYINFSIDFIERQINEVVHSFVKTVKFVESLMDMNSSCKLILHQQLIKMM